LLLLAPFVPFTAEELNERFGYSGFVSIGRWPEPDMKAIDESSLLGESLVQRTIEDIKGILAVVKQPVSKAQIYVAPSERVDLFKKVASSVREGRPDGEIIKAAVSSSSSNEKSSAAALAQSMIKESRAIGDDVLVRLLRAKRFDEEDIWSEAAGFIADETGLKDVQVLPYSEGKTKGKKPLNPLPFKPAIVLE